MRLEKMHICEASPADHPGQYLLNSPHARPSLGTHVVPDEVLLSSPFYRWGNLSILEVKQFMQGHRASKWQCPGT